MDTHTLTVVLGITVPFFLLTIGMLVDISMKNFPSPAEKAIWWIVALIPFTGWLIYLMFGFRRGKRPGKP
jgi:Kef-type K+ transport system membrane component KefB